MSTPNTYISLVVITFLMSTIANAGTKIGNGDGGDAVYCKADNSPGSKTPVSGYYALDYLGTIGLQFGENANIASWRESAIRIQSILDRVSPTLAASFREYVRDIKNTDYTHRFVWEESPYGLIKIDDQNIVALAPDNCQVNHTLELIPAVVHQNDRISGRPPGMQLYAFVPSVLNQLEQTSPLQLSFLYVHEWLWNHSDNVGRNRRISRFLHSVMADTMSDRTVADQLTGMGLDLGEAPPIVRPGSPAVPPANSSTMKAPESSDIQAGLFANDNLCASRASEPAFRLYSQFNQISSDLTSYRRKYEPFGFNAGDGTAHMSTYQLTPNFTADGDEIRLTLNGGEVAFECIGTKLEAAMGSVSMMQCELRRGGETLYWPNSSTPVTFTGKLYPGCFVAKAETRPQYHHGYAIVITGSY